MEKQTTVWKDREGTEYALKEIDDRYLINILNFLEKGGGYVFFLTDEKIHALFKEARIRGLKFTADEKTAIDAYYTRVEYESLIDALDCLND